LQACGSGRSEEAYNILVDILARPEAEAKKAAIKGLGNLNMTLTVSYETPPDEHRRHSRFIGACAGGFHTTADYTREHKYNNLYNKPKTEHIRLGFVFYPSANLLSTVLFSIIL
jgi:hypothetical protein